MVAAWAMECVGAWLSYECRCDSRIAFGVCMRTQELSGATVRRKGGWVYKYRRMAARQIDRARLGYDGSGIRGIGI